MKMIAVGTTITMSDTSVKDVENLAPGDSLQSQGGAVTVASVTAQILPSLSAVQFGDSIIVCDAYQRFPLVEKEYSVIELLTFLTKRSGNDVARLSAFDLYGGVVRYKSITVHDGGTVYTVMLALKASYCANGIMVSSDNE